MTFHPSGQVNSIVLANAARTDLTFNNRYWPATLTHKDASAQNLVNSSYVYDGVGNTTSITDTADNIYNRTLAYDDIDRVTTTTSTPVWGTGSVTYNGRGDILTQAQGAGFSLTYTYNGTSGLLTAVSGSVSYPSITYDVYGNVTGNGVHTFEYDDTPSMTCSNCAGAARADYVYDGKGMRVKSVKSGLTTYSFYAANGNLLFEYDPASSAYSDNVYLQDKLVSKRTPSSTVYFHDDLLGSPMAATDTAGALAWRENYRPYGSQLLGQGNAENSLWFTAKSLDQETKLSYVGARYYDTQLGRFMGMDPALFDETNSHSVNRYAYGNNNPFKFKDPNGQWAQAVVWSGIRIGSILGVRSLAPAIAAGAKQLLGPTVGGIAACVGAGICTLSESEENAGVGYKGGNSDDKPKTPGDILAPNGQPIGEKEGSSGPGVRTVTPGQQDNVIDDLKGLGATPGSKGNYPGDWYDLPNNQGGFGIRDSRGSGRTVDVNVPGVPDVTKIHQKP